MRTGGGVANVVIRPLTRALGAVEAFGVERQPAVQSIGIMKGK